ncbi:hypothetical protein [Thiorhodovibrio winogradskyi]|uniref:hypothetical protein n=1 Tax=Thiorhodovibrio winogradskyi TaxID=77007 RepID=UPI002E2BAFA7|nr:hypothetical protein [Thiorhodovibrio winogradskyi]
MPSEFHGELGNQGDGVFTGAAITLSIVAVVAKYKGQICVIQHFNRPSKQPAASRQFQRNSFLGALTPAGCRNLVVTIEGLETAIEALMDKAKLGGGLHAAPIFHISASETRLVT